MNNGSDYVFKFSRFIAENIAVHMDIDQPYNILQEENAYFDTIMASNPSAYGHTIQQCIRQFDWQV